MHRDNTILTWLAHACFDCQHAVLLSTAVMLQLSQPLHQQCLVQSGSWSTPDTCNVSVLSTMAVSVAVKVLSIFEGMYSLISAHVGAVLRVRVAAGRKSWSGLQALLLQICCGVLARYALFMLQSCTSASAVAIAKSIYTNKCGRQAMVLVQQKSGALGQKC